VTHYTGATPDTAGRRTDWLATAPCKADPEAMFPGTLSAEIEHAKSYCRVCPAVARCLQWALNNREDHGVWGGLTEDERRNRLRRTARGTHKPRGPQLPHPASLRELLDRHTNPQPGGHLLWTGAKCPDFRSRQYTPNQIAFILDRGYEPNGTVQRSCDVRGCVQALHLADTQERRQRAAATKAAV
jgi:hypothetical protein